MSQLQQLQTSLSYSSNVRDAVMEQCHISRTTLSLWKHGKVKIPFWANEYITHIIKEEKEKLYEP